MQARHLKDRFYERTSLIYLETVVCLAYALMLAALFEQNVMPMSGLKFGYYWDDFASVDF